MFTLGIPNRQYRRATQVLGPENANPIEYNSVDQGDGFYIFSFDLGWKIARRFDLSKIEASMKDGLLKLYIPLTPENKPKTVSIK